MSESSPPEQPDSRLIKSRARPKNAGRKLPIFNSGVFWTTIPALALFALATATSRTPLPAPIGVSAKTHRSVISASDWVVPASETIFVSRQSTGGHSTLRGRLASSQADAVPAPSGGMVSQILVQRGQMVRAGQQVAILTTGIAPPASQTEMPSPVENAQSRAEAAQIAAAQQQEKLESRMKAANVELARAKERVTTAQQRVAEARQLIARLRNGEQISAREAPAAPATPPRSSRRDTSKSAALRETQKLQSEAEAAEAQAKTAQSAARDAEADASAKQQKLKAALAAAKSAAKADAAKSGAGSTPEADDDGNSADSKTNSKNKTSGEEAQNSLAVASARAVAASATAHALDTKREAVRLQTRATQARSKANDAVRRATQDLQVFDGDAGVQAQGKTQTPSSGGGKMTVAQAVRIAQAALKESDAAIKNAERIQKKVESYNRPVANTRQKFNQAAQQLEAAQQQMWDRAPAMRTTQTPVVSPRDGVVTWVAAPSSVVHGGEAVVSVGRPDRLEVVVEDKSGAWKTLKPNARVLALVQRRHGARAGDTGAAGSTPTAGDALPRAMTTSTRGDDEAISIPTLARVLFVAPPGAPGRAARIRIAVHNPPEIGSANANGLSPRAFAPGMPVFFSIARPSKTTALSIPTAAVRRGQNGRTFVAVLTPVKNQAQDRLADQCRVEWREVFLAPGDGVSNRVKMGLKEGERLALRPDALYDFTLVHGAQATVSVEQI